MSADLLAAFGDPSNPSQSNDGDRREEPNADHTTNAFAFAQSNYIHQPSGGNRGTVSSDQQGTEVLFDASTEFTLVDDGDEEWGEFETAEQPSRNNDGILLIEDDESAIYQPAETGSGRVSPAGYTKEAPKSSQLPDVDLLSIGDEPKSATSDTRAVKHVKQPVRSTERRPPGLGNFVKPPRNTEQKKEKEEEGEEEEEEDWGDFIDGAKDTNPGTTQMSTPIKQNLPTAAQSQRKLHEKKPEPKSEGPIIRPTNIPPPSILLPLFPPVLLESRRAALAHKSKDNPSNFTNEDIPSTILRNLKAMVHVLLGRQLRWKRDHILSQSTKIGPARSGKPGGMKLSSVNKTENVKEQQEAVEVMDSWKKHSTVLNSAISAAGHRPIPAIFSSTQVRTAKAEEGALKATHSCALCGLKRDERIPKVDEDVNDSFGEWWVEHWGHSDCKVFWEANFTKLDHR